MCGNFKEANAETKNAFLYFSAAVMYTYKCCALKKEKDLLSLRLPPSASLKISHPAAECQRASVETTVPDNSLVRLGRGSKYVTHKRRAAAFCGLPPNAEKVSSNMLH